MSPRTVLIIDDEEDIRVLVTMLLEMDGDFAVIEASSGEDGIELAAASRPAVILLDHMMPGLDGPSTLARLRRNPSTAAIPVVFLTGKAHSGSTSAFESFGADGVISKPVDPMGFAAELSAILSRISPK